MRAGAVGGGVFFYDYVTGAIAKDKPASNQALAKQDQVVIGSRPAQSTKASAKGFDGFGSGDDQQSLDFEPVIEGKPETAPAYRHLLKVQSVPTLAGCIKSEHACKCYTQQATPYPVTWEQCLEHVANLKFNPYVPPRTGAITAPVNQDIQPQASDS